MVVKYWERKGLLRQPSRERLKWVYQHKKQHQDMHIPHRLWSYQLLQILSQSLDLGSLISRYRLHPAIQTHHTPEKSTLKNWWQVFGSMQKLLQYLKLKHKNKSSIVEIAIHTLTKQSWKWRRMREAAIRVSAFRAFITCLRTIKTRYGHDLA